MDVQIVKGDLSLTDIAKGIKPAADIQRDDENLSGSRRNTSGNNNLDYTAVNAYNSAVTGRLHLDAAASIIVGRIRVKFFNGIHGCSENGNQEFDISSLRYMDEILFNDLEYLIRSIIRFGGKGACIKLSQCMRIIRDTAGLVSYKLDNEAYTDIENILRVIYNE